MSETNAVALKLPTFWTSKPALWFCSVEAQFNIRKIDKDETKYYYVVAALTDDMACAVSELLMNPPTEEKYRALKTALLQFYRTPPVKKVMNFVQQGTVTDRRPREVAKEIGCLDADLSQVRMALFVNSMPKSIQTHLLAREFKDVGEMADTAEALTSQGLHQFTTQELNSVSSATGCSSKGRPTQRPSGDLCYFHKRFGNRARRCRPPCRLSHTVNAAHHDDDNQGNAGMFP